MQPISLGAGQQFSTSPDFSNVASSLPLSFILQQLFPGGIPTPNNSVSGSSTPAGPGTPPESNVATVGQPMQIGGGEAFTAGGVGSGPPGPASSMGTPGTTMDSVAHAADVLGFLGASSLVGPIGSVIGAFNSAFNKDSILGQLLGETPVSALMDALGLSSSNAPSPSASDILGLNPGIDPGAITGAALDAGIGVGIAGGSDPGSAGYGTSAGDPGYGGGADSGAGADSGDGGSGAP